MLFTIKAFAEALTVGSKPKAHANKAEQSGTSMGDFYRQTGQAFGQNVTSVNGRWAKNERNQNLGTKKTTSRK